MLFGTAKRLATCPEKLHLHFREVSINSTKEYKYLGSVIDQTLNLGNNFDQLYKNASKKLNRLSKIKGYLTKDAAKKVYECVILPGIKYNCLLNLHLTQTQSKRLDSLDKKSLKNRSENTEDSQHHKPSRCANRQKVFR